MNFLKEIHPRLIQTQQFVSLLQSQLSESNVSNNCRSSCISNCQQLIVTARTIQEHILKCFRSVGVYEENYLDTLQNCCEILGKIWLDLRAQLYFLRMDGLMKEVEKMLQQLIKSTVIVNKQPPQVIKTNSKFQSCVRFLCGSFFINTNTKVTASISNGALTNRESIILRSANNDFLANFPELMVRKVTRTEKKGSVSVTDEKFIIIFEAEVKLANGQLVFVVKTVSVPVVVIVHSNQEIRARATIFWHSFASPDDKSTCCHVPDKVPWIKVGQKLSEKFESINGCPLTVDDLSFLAAKVFRDEINVNYDSMFLSWSKFAKEPLPNVTFTFWEWFHSIVKLTKDHLKGFWSQENRLIHGFRSRKSCENELSLCIDGTFILRFSESFLGCLSAAVINRSNPKIFHNLAPFSCKDLSTRSLANRIMDIDQLKYLSPGIPKEQAFGPFCESQSTQELSQEYEGWGLVTRVFGWGSGNEGQQTPRSDLSSQNEFHTNNQSFQQNQQFDRISDNLVDQFIDIFDLNQNDLANDLNNFNNFDLNDLDQFLQ